MDDEAQLLQLIQDHGMLLGLLLQLALSFGWLDLLMTVYALETSRPNDCSASSARITPEGDLAI